VIKYVYEIDYPFGEKRKYLEWVRSIAETLQAPGELRRLASYDNVFSATPHRRPKIPSRRARPAWAATGGPTARSSASSDGVRQEIIMGRDPRSAAGAPCCRWPWVPIGAALAGHDLEVRSRPERWFTVV
jgi:hypothetical protein